MIYLIHTNMKRIHEINTDFCPWQLVSAMTRTASGEVPHPKLHVIKDSQVYDTASPKAPPDKCP